MKPSAYSLTSLDWGKALGSANILSFWLDGLYKDATIWDRHINKDKLLELKATYDFELPQISQILESSDETVKFQVRFADGMEVETVLIPFHKRNTVCLSTQVGCGMNCSFCYTGTQGLKRNLSAGEIVGQYLIAMNWLFEKEPKAMKPNIVFMGQGEPLHNVDEVLKAIQVLNDPRTIGVGPRQMTLSTVGYVPSMKRLSEFPKINFALSLHSPFDPERTKLIPVNGRYPLAEVLEYLDKLPLSTRQFITYEYLLIKNLNMTDAHIEALHSLLGERKAILNLIPFNPFPGSEWERPGHEEIDSFKKRLVERKLRVMVRTTKGDDILAACGQLKINKLARNYGTK